MTKQFNVGDKFKYTHPSNGRTINGVVKEIHPCNNQESYNITLDGNNEEYNWYSGRYLSLVSTADSTTVHEVKELKAELESEILRLIQDFNKKTNLQIKDIDLDCYQALGGGCFYHVGVKVEMWV